MFSLFKVSIMYIFLFLLSNLSAQLLLLYKEKKDSKGKVKEEKREWKGQKKRRAKK